MGCVSSSLLHNEDELSQFGSSAFSHHIVSLTSTTYGLLNIDPPPPASPAATTPPALGPIFPTPLREPKPLPDCPETINSWELMSTLDSDPSFRFSPILTIDNLSCSPNDENSNPNFLGSFKDPSLPNKPSAGSPVLKPLTENAHSLDSFEKLCPPNGDNKVVIYTTSLRGIRETFDACNVVRAAIGGFGFSVCERDVSMDRGFREELKELMEGNGPEGRVPPRVFVKGRYIGGVEEVMRMVEEGVMGELLQGLPLKRAGHVCDGCGDVRFLPCFSCNGSSKMRIVAGQEFGLKQRTTVVVRCPDCNENGLVLCPICA